LIQPAHVEVDWAAPPGVVAFTTLRSALGTSQAPFDSFNLGMRCGDDPDVVAHNRSELIERFALPSPPRWLRQVHGTAVARFDGRGLVAAAADEPEADAAVTATPGVVLAILTADCLPVVFAASGGSEVAAAHAGWRGLSAGVLEATVAAMHASPNAIDAWLGPAAGPQAYEIGEEVFATFVDRDPRAATAFVPTRPGHWRVDLYALARQRLADAGVTRVSGGGLCTISDPHRFYSHRRDQRTGRMATLVWRR
jgi:YfiH family protein